VQRAGFTHEILADLMGLRDLGHIDPFAHHN
ncbi:MAG: hypothetical protein JWQ55_423, partial [Rhodopila sp.]|nr:hypothetical protein [Rhodopila sp.]